MEEWSSCVLHGILFSLPNSCRTKTLKTCEDLKTSPYNETGFYTLDPDGSGEPVDFFCDMDKGFTEVWTV